MEDLAGVVLAAGRGRRMKSRIPKVLHQVCGKELVRYSVELLKDVGVGKVLVVVSPENQIAIEGVLGEEVEYIVQSQPLGTADALGRCADALRDACERVLVVGGDIPLVTAASVRRLLTDQQEYSSQMSLLTVTGSTKSDLGRVTKTGNRVLRVVEAADLPDVQDKAGGEVNAGVYCFQAKWLWPAILD